MYVLTEREHLLASKRIYDHRRRQDKRRYIENHSIPNVVKRVKVIYPGCAAPDLMSMSQYCKWNTKDFPPGTRVTIDGVTKIL